MQSLHSIRWVAFGWFREKYRFFSVRNSLLYLISHQVLRTDGVHLHPRKKLYLNTIKPVVLNIKQQKTYVNYLGALKPRQN